MKKYTLALILALTISLTATTVFAANMLTNPDFETGDLTGWIPFGNTFHSIETGGNAAKMFGNFSGGFNVSGMFQEFTAAPGDEFMMDADSFHLSSDPMIGAGAPDDNWVVMKIAFFDAAGAEIGAAEGTILDASFPTDVWVDNSPITGIAPAGTVKVQALLLYLQPEFDGGAAHIDNVVFDLIELTAVTLQGSEAQSASTLSLSVVTFAILASATLIVVNKRQSTQ